MTFFKVSISNLRRNPVRSVLTGLSLAVSAATLCVVLSLWTESLGRVKMNNAPYIIEQ